MNTKTVQQSNKAPQSLKLICKRKRISFYQCDFTDRYYLQIQNSYYSFRVCEFIVFRKKMKELDISEFFKSDAPDFHLFELVHCEKLFLLSLDEIIQLKTLTEETVDCLRANALLRNVLN